MEACGLLKARLLQTLGTARRSSTSSSICSGQGATITRRSASRNSSSRGWTSLSCVTVAVLLATTSCVRRDPGLGSRESVVAVQKTETTVVVWSSGRVVWSGPELEIEREVSFVPRVAGISMSGERVVVASVTGQIEHFKRSGDLVSRAEGRAFGTGIAGIDVLDDGTIAIAGTPLRFLDEAFSELDSTANYIGTAVAGGLAAFVVGDAGGRVIVWTRGDSPLELVGKHEQPVAAVAIDSSENFVASGTNSGDVRIWSRRDLKGSNLRGSSGAPVTALAFMGGDQSLLIALGPRVELWDSGVLGSSFCVPFDVRSISLSGNSVTLGGDASSFLSGSLAQFERRSCD